MTTNSQSALQDPLILQKLVSLPWKKNLGAELVPLFQAGRWDEARTSLLARIPAAAFEIRKDFSKSVWPLLDQYQRLFLPELHQIHWECDGAEEPQAAQDLSEGHYSAITDLSSAHMLLVSALFQRADVAAEGAEMVPSNDEFSQSWQAILGEEREVFPEELPASLLPVVGLRLLQLSVALLLTAERLSAEQFWLSWLWLAHHSQKLNLLTSQPESDHEPALAALFLRGELTQTFGYWFDAVFSQSDLQRQGRQAAAKQLDACTDTDGTPHLELFPVLTRWIASFVRQQLLAEIFEGKFLTSAGRKRWEELLERVSSLTSGSGQLVLTFECDGSPAVREAKREDKWAEVLHAALNQQPDSHKLGWAYQTLLNLPESAGVRPKLRKRIPSSSAESAATHSAWGHLSCLRNNWYAGSDLLAICYGQLVPRLEMSALSTPLLRGEWETTLLQNGAPLSCQEEEWDCLCWYNEEAGDYLELHLSACGVTIDRQLFLSRTDHIAILSDTVKSDQPDSEIELNWSLPLMAGWEVKEQAGQRDVVLKNRRNQVRLLPLSLPQERIDSAPGHLQFSEGRIQYQQQGKQNLCMTALLDWSPERRRQPADWARLTVTQERKVLSSQEAFGARARIGRHQWLYFRNLEYSGLPRAVLGLHTDAETVIAEFLATGQTEKLVEVQYGEEE